MIIGALFDAKFPVFSAFFKVLKNIEVRLSNIAKF